MYSYKKTFFEILGDFFDRDYYAATTVSIFAGILMLYSEFTKFEIRTEKDLCNISGELYGFSFKNKVYSKYRVKPKISHEYYIWLENYSNGFQIFSDDIDFFKAKKFSQSVKKGQKIYLTIQEGLRPKLNNTGEYIRILSIDTKTNNFLNKKKTIERINDNWLFYCGLIFIFFGVIYYFIRRFIWTP